MKETATAQLGDSSADVGLPPASLIIGSRNRPQLLLETVESVLRGEEVPAELVIIDQSDRRHPALASLTTERACKIRYMQASAIGVSRARNAGIGATQHDILAFTDDDVLVAPDWFGSLIRALICAGPRAVITGRVESTSAEESGSFAPSLKVDLQQAVHAGRIGADVLFSGNMACHRAAFQEVGVFDERLGPGTSFPAAEDNDIGYRLLEAGYRIVYMPQAVVYHRAWRGDRDLLRLRWRYGRGQGAYYAKHLHRDDLYMARRLSREVGRCVHGAARNLLWRHPQRACGYALYILGLISGLTQWLLGRGRWRASGDAQ